MKKLPSHTRIILLATIGISLVFFSLAFGSGTTVSQATAPTPTPTMTKAELALEVGSTDGIMIWAIIIIIIIIMPILWHWIQWIREKKQVG